MLIVLEGPDGAGKTTLAGQLARHLDAELHESCRPASRAESDAINEIHFGYAAEPGIHIVDRVNWISNRVYHEAGLSPDQISDPKGYKRYWDVPQIIIYCEHPDPANPNFVTTGKAWKPSKYVERVKARHAEVVKLYEVFFRRKCPLLFYRFNYTKPNALGQVLNYIEEQINDR